MVLVVFCNLTHIYINICVLCTCRICTYTLMYAIIIVVVIVVVVTFAADIEYCPLLFNTCVPITSLHYRLGLICFFVVDYVFVWI